MDTGILVLRLLLAAILFTHAMQKVLGWFGGNGLVRQGELFDTLGLRPGRAMVAMAATAELTGAVLLALGVLTPLGALVATGTMTVAGLTMQHSAGKFWNSGGGGEYPYVLAVLAVVLGITGPGSVSLDAAIGGPLFSFAAEPPAWMGAVIVVVAATAAVPFVTLIRRNRS